MLKPTGNYLWVLWGIAYIFVSLFVFWGCSRSNVLRDDFINAVEETPRDSLRAKFNLTLTINEGKEQNFDAVLFSVPGKRYRMELTGPMGIGVASVLWKEDGWFVVFPTEKMYVQGAGYMVGIFSDNTIPMVHIHQVAAIFEGNLLPADFKDLEGGNAEEQNGRRFSYGIVDSNVTWLSRISSDGKEEKYKFEDFKNFENVKIPSHVVFELDGKKYLEIRVKSVKHGKPFSFGTWRLNIPKSFTRIE